MKKKWKCPICGGNAYMLRGEHEYRAPDSLISEPPLIVEKGYHIRCMSCDLLSAECGTQKAAKEDGSCALLKVNKCSEARQRLCRFKHTEETLRTSREKAYKRIRAKSETDQREIADRCYGGAMPWREV